MNNLTGGVVVAKSQLRFGPSGSIGPCTVTVLGNSTLFSDATSAPDVKYVESDQAFMGSTGYMLTIKSVGVTVTGTGAIQIGPPQGTTVLFR